LAPTQDGGKQKRSTSEDVQKDFLALEIRGGKVVFTFNLGSGAAKLVSNNQVNDGKWHQVIAER
jgi:laminin, alpha 3/5